jgi:hypothetical protein
MSFTSWRRAHRISISQTTTSKNLGAFGSTTQTPYTPYETQVRKDEVARELYKVPESREARKAREVGKNSVKMPDSGRVW